MKKLQGVIEKMMQNYDKYPIKHDHCACRLPSNKEIKEIIMLSKDMMFPGYFDGHYMEEKGNLRHTAIIAKKLHRKLKAQISSSLRYILDEKQTQSIKQTSCTLCVEFMNRLPIIREKLLLDLQAHFDSDPAAFNKDQIVLSYPGFYAILIYRLAHELDLLNVAMIPRMMSEFAHRETGIDIHPRAQIGESFFIDHGTGIVIGETSTIGNHVKIYQGVTLGAMSLRKGQALKNTKRHPTIEGNVTLYSGASIFGGNTVIGKNSVIGSNVFITESIPENSKVTLEKPKLVVSPNEKQS